MKRLKTHATLLSALLLTSLCSAIVPAHAAPLTASLQPESWTASGPGTTTITPSTGPTDSLVFGYSLNPAGFNTQTWQFSESAPYNGPVTFNWEHTGYHSFFAVTEFVNAFADSPTGRTTISLASNGPANCCSAPSGGFDYKGTGSLTVYQGYNWGFQVGGSNFDSDNVLQGNLTLTNVSTPSAPTPEPGAIGLMSAGLLSIVALTRQRQRRSVAPLTD